MTALLGCVAPKLSRYLVQPKIAIGGVDVLASAGAKTRRVMKSSIHAAVIGLQLPHVTRHI
jgi:hypothetical protein